MTFFPDTVNPRAAVVAVFHMVDISTPDGDFGFLIGGDGVFVDVNGKSWVGSSLVAASTGDYAMNGVAPEGQVALSYYQDPAAPDLVAELTALGLEHVRDRLIRFYVQPFRSLAEMQAPTLPPILDLTRRMTRLEFSKEGAQGRRITLFFESPWAFRRNSRRMIYSTEDHATIVGAPNPSLQFMPTDTVREEPLF